MKNGIKLQHDDFRTELEGAEGLRCRLQQRALPRVPLQRDAGGGLLRSKTRGISEREKIKRRTMRKRKRRYLAEMAAWVETMSRYFATSIRRVKYLDDVQTNE